MLEQLERFLATATLPALLEPGEALLPLTGLNHSLDPRASHVLLQAWEEHRNLSRKITAARQDHGRLELSVQRFGGKEGKLLLLDLAHPRVAEVRKRGRKQEFRERFGRFLHRELPEWTVTSLSTEPNLEHSLSPAFPRALLRRGTKGIAAIAAPPALDDPAGILTFGLIWLAYLRARNTKLAVEELLLFLPAGREQQTALRIPFLTPNCRLYIFDDSEETARVDLRDAGNLNSLLAPCHRAPAHSASADPALAALAGFEQVAQPDGTASLRIHGLEFARLPGAASNAELVAHARELSRLRSAAGSLLHAQSPERWLESQVRSHLDQIDPALQSAPVYGQVPAFTAGDRGVADLLAIERSGRLAVLELKASADLQLPLQALDYWMRVAHHAALGDFTRAGYFPGHPVSVQAPKLILVAPSLEFHSTAETVLSFFLPLIEVTRVGLAAGWREGPRAMFRLTGANHPA